MLDLTGLFRPYARWRIGRQALVRAEEIQIRQLVRMAHGAARTRFGADHGFSGIRGVADFQRRTPLRSYDDFWDEYWRRDFPVLQDLTASGVVPYFALTSGTTTGTTKYIPYTQDMSRSAVRGMTDLICYHMLARPESRLLSGSAVMLTGSEALETLAPGIQSGAVSAIAARRTPRLLRRRLLPSADLAAVDDWQEKIRRLVPLSLASDVRGLGGSPNWLLIFLDEVAWSKPSRGTRLVDWYPGLELIVHGGVNFAPYRRRFRELLQGSRAETREVYSASEGFFAVADRGDGEGLRLLVDGGLFFEFVPVEELTATEPVRHWVATIEPGVEYAVVISSPAGLWAYQLGDTVRFLSRDPPRLLVTGRTSYILSAFGEHLIEQELAEAVSIAAEAIGVDVVDYTCTARMAGGERSGGMHDFLVECAPQPPGDAEIARFTEVLDGRLAALNDDYRELRQRDYSLRPPRIRFAPAGGFVAWMKQHRGLGGQNKVPRILNDVAMFDELAAFMARERCEGAG